MMRPTCLVMAVILLASACGGDDRTALEERNKTVVRQWIADIDKAPNVEVLDKWLAPDFKAEFNGTPVDLKTYRELMAGFLKAFSDFKHELTSIVAEGDHVAIGMTVHMTHTGDYEGLAPTGRRVTMVEQGVVRVVNGKIAQESAVADLASLDRQLRPAVAAK